MNFSTGVPNEKQPDNYRTEEYAPVCAFCSADITSRRMRGGGSTSATTTPTTTTAIPFTLYMIGVEVSGLTSGSLVLQNNGGETLTVSSNGATTFATSLAKGTGYAVTVATQPNGQACTVSNGTGTVESANVTGITVACVASWVGTKQLGVAGVHTYGEAAATDASGNVFVAGQTFGDLDGNSRVGTSDFFVTKYDSSGAKQYTKQLGATGAETHGYATATDVNGNFYVAGTTSGALDDNTKTGTHDFFVTKYDKDGSKQYTKQMGVAGKRQMTPSPSLG